MYLKKHFGFDWTQEEKSLWMIGRRVTLEQEALAKRKHVARKHEELQRERMEKMGNRVPQQQQRQQENGGKGQRGVLWGDFTFKMPSLRSLPPLYLPMELIFAIVTFRGTLLDQWQRQHYDEQPPGCCYLQGDIELVGSKGRARLMVTATYNPRTDRIHNTQFQVRIQEPHLQIAKGGK